MCLRTSGCSFKIRLCLIGLSSSSLWSFIFNPPPCSGPIEGGVQSGVGSGVFQELAGRLVCGGIHFHKEDLSVLLRHRSPPYKPYFIFPCVALAVSLLLPARVSARLLPPPLPQVRNSSSSCFLLSESSSIFHFHPPLLHQLHENLRLTVCFCTSWSFSVCVSWS